MILTIGCKTPPVPPEAERAEALDGELWRAGGAIFLPAEYDRYHRELSALRSRLARERAKFALFRKYEDLQKDLRWLIEDGNSLLDKIEETKSSKSTAFAAAAAELGTQVARLKEMTSFFNETSEIRIPLAQAEIKLAEARILVAKGEYDGAGAALTTGGGHILNARGAIAKLLTRYVDRKQLARWKAWADETIAESREKGTVAVVVNKIERTLKVYRGGATVAVYEIGLGKYGLSDKLRSGDEATPEGRYKIIRKFPESPFFKAMLIDYPNEEDKRAFAEARRQGILPRGATIGGAIEIHGGGKDNLTKGCVGLEDADMDEVFRLADVGTPVTIIGAISIENTILADIQGFGDHE